jgi:hypothetical protein
MQAKAAIVAKTEPTPAPKKTVSKSKSPIKSKSPALKGKSAPEESKVAPAKGNSKSSRLLVFSKEIGGKSSKVSNTS